MCIRDRHTSGPGEPKVLAVLEFTIIRLNFLLNILGAEGEGERQLANL